MVAAYKTTGYQRAAAAAARAMDDGVHVSRRRHDDYQRLLFSNLQLFALACVAAVSGAGATSETARSLYECATALALFSLLLRVRFVEASYRYRAYTDVLDRYNPMSTLAALAFLCGFACTAARASDWEHAVPHTIALAVIVERTFTLVWRG